MVPEQGTKTVQLTEDTGLTVRIASEATANVQLTEQRTSSGRRIEIKPQSAGEARLAALNGQTVVASLDVSVLPFRQFKISVRFVYDKGGEITGRPLSNLGYRELEEKVKAMNRIFFSQINLGVRLLSSGPTHVSDDLSRGLLFRADGIAKAELSTLGPALHVYRSSQFPRLGCVSGRMPGPEGCDPSGVEAVPSPILRGKLRALDQEFNVFRRTDPNADFTFLLINKLIDAPDVGAYTEADGCILPDTVPSSGRAFVMAHEFGHFLLGRRPDGTAWHTKDARDLMFTQLATLASNLGFRIRKAEAIQMAKRVPK
jgi:hypothetical protein